MYSALMIIFVCLCSQVALAKRNTRPHLDLSRTVRIQYQNPAWNQSATKVDSASIIIKDAVTGKTVRVEMSEDSADSSTFSGHYSISWKEIRSSKPEIYDNAETSTQRLPYIYRRDENGAQFIEAFSTRQEAESALAKYKAEQDRKLKKSEEIPEALVETAEQTRKRLDALKKVEDEKQRIQQRELILANELKKREISQSTFKKLPLIQQKNRIKSSKAFVESAMDFFKANQFSPAEERFKKSLDLNPFDHDASFYYGVSLYKRDEFNQSLVFLEMAKEGTFNPLERDFFKGLNHFKLEEFGSALRIFGEIKSSKDKVFGPTSAFYEGMIRMKLEEYDQAKLHFQEVLDTSDDPALDQSAEDYIEKIERLKAFEKLKARKWFFSGSMGLQYDSNVLLVNSSSPSSSDPSKVSDYRALTGIGIEYRPVYTQTSEFSVKTKGDLIYSSKGENVGADPLIYSVKFPYKHKGRLLEKGFKLEVVPGYETLFLDEDKSGATGGYLSSFNEKELYLKSFTLDWLNTVVMSTEHFLSLNLKYRQDDSESTVATGDNSPSARKYSLNVQNIFFFNQKKNLGLIGDVGYSLNRTDGKNLAHHRYDLSAMTLFPVGWNFQGIGGVSYFLANYSERNPTRTDNNVSLSLNFVRPLNDWLNLTLGGTYSDNQSSISTNTYQKYLMMAVLTANWSP